jgi:hypothetical protein
MPLTFANLLKSLVLFALAAGLLWLARPRPAVCVDCYPLAVGTPSQEQKPVLQKAQTP